MYIDMIRSWSFCLYGSTRGTIQALGSAMILPINTTYDSYRSIDTSWNHKKSISIYSIYIYIYINIYALSLNPKPCLDLDRALWVLCPAWIPIIYPTCPSCALKTSPMHFLTANPTPTFRSICCKTSSSPDMEVVQHVHALPEIHFDFRANPDPV